MWPSWLAPLIPMVFQVPPRMQWALAGAKALGVRQLAAALVSCTNNVSVPMFPISPMTGHATRFDPANRATEHTPVGCGEESPRSCRRVRRNTGGRERGRPRPHQSDAPISHQFRSSQSSARTLNGWESTNNVCVPLFAYCLLVGCAWVAWGMWKINSFAGAFGCQGTTWWRSSHFERGMPCTEWRVPVRHYYTECLVGLKRSRITAEISLPPLDTYMH
ncbi:MAG: hypothetical protein GX456_07610 [Verrucomicrobia bacterium]|nr:hypothetical protein [Verrucomicrobiota bacterium]